MTGNGIVRVFDDISEARTQLITRHAIESGDLPPHIQAGIRAQWGEALSAEQVVERICRLVREGGDVALRELAQRIDGVDLHAIEVSREEIDAAYGKVPEAVITSLRFAADRVRRFHERQRRNSWYEPEEGFGQLFRPLERVGLYAPGGTAPYPSTTIMTAVPARVAGVQHIYLTSPAGRDGNVAPVTLVGADIAGVDRIFRLGGAAAIAAFAYGTETVPAVDKILGPGNHFVALAKRLVSADVAIDSIAGPTETLIVADDSADADTCAADLLAQAEHDALAQPILITTSRNLAERTVEALERQLPTLERETIARASVLHRGGIVITDDLNTAFDLANEYAPEHLCLLVREPWNSVDRVRNAGGIFIGESAAEALGDYVIGPSHVMPTGGTARHSSPLSTNDFVKIISVFAPTPALAETLAPHAATLARAEGLTGHAASAERRSVR